MGNRSRHRKGKASAAAVTQTNRDVWYESWLWGALLVVAVVLAYQKAWHADFIWDDDQHITHNPCIVGPLGFKEIWTTSAARICPLVLSTFWFEHKLWGLSSFGYHLVTLGMHAAGAVVLWRV